jgi:5-bromo-4-chloroindolyl phosphate hydrolysis protein.
MMKRKTNTGIATISVKSILLITFSGTFLLGALICYIVFLAVDLPLGSAIALACCLIAILPTTKGYYAIMSAATLRKLVSSTTPGIPLSLAKASSYTQRPENALLWDVSLLRNSGILRSMAVLDNSLVLELWDSAQPILISTDDQYTFAEANRRRPYPALATGTIGLCAALLLPFPLHWLLKAMIGLVLGSVLAKLPLGKLQYTILQESAKPVAPPKEAAAPAKTNDPEVDSLLAKGNSYLLQLETLDRLIENEHISQRIVQLTDITRQIFGLVEEAPEKRRQIRQHIDYYLPTTIKLLSNYEDLSRQPVKGENIKGAMDKIEEMMDVVVTTFRKELDLLYQDKHIDISVDIEVMQKMMQQHDMNISKL